MKIQINASVSEDREILNNRLARIGEIQDLSEEFDANNFKQHTLEQVELAKSLLEEFFKITPAMLSSVNIHPLEEGGFNFEIGRLDELIFLELQPSQFEVYSILEDSEHYFTFEQVLEVAELVTHFWQNASPMINDPH